MGKPEKLIVIRTPDPLNEVRARLLDLINESEEYAGEISVVVLDPETGKAQNLSRVYDVAPVAINVLREYYGERHIWVITP